MNNKTKIIVLVVILISIIAVVITISISKKEKIKDYSLLTITKSDNSCIKKNAICENGTKLNIKVKDDTNYNFYVIDDDGENITLIMDHNIIKTMSWTDDSTCSMGPNKLLSKIGEVTEQWANIETKNYTINDKDNCYDTIHKSLKARLLTSEEAEKLGCQYAVENTCPNYLISNLNKDIPGYWLSTTKQKAYGLVIHRAKDIASCGLEVNCSAYYGLRLVIEVKK